jgi:cytochrome c2
MKKLASTLIAAGLVATSLAAATAITAKKVDADLSKVSYDSPVWEGVTFEEVTLYPQRTIQLNDKQANELNANDWAKVAHVAAVYNNDRIAFLMKWPDETMNIQNYDPMQPKTGLMSNAYPDGFAVQIASKVEDVNALPYIGMGSDGRPVVIHMQKAVRNFFEPNGNGNVYYQLNREQTEVFNNQPSLNNPELLEQGMEAFDNQVDKLANNDYERSFVSEGFRSTTEIKDGSSASYARLGYNDEIDVWSGTLSRPLNDDYVTVTNGSIPVAFAAWNGAKMGRDGLKNLSQWIAVSFEGQAGDEALIAAVGEQAQGDVAAGQEAAMTNGCTGCHQMTIEDPQNYMGPGLVNIGGYATAGYLRESLKNPSAVVVPGYNRNAHSNTPWYNVVDGQRVSTMPDFSWMDDATINNIVAYLQTLKMGVK